MVANASLSVTPTDLGVLQLSAASPSVPPDSASLLFLGALCLLGVGNAFHFCQSTCSVLAEVTCNKPKWFPRLIPEAWLWFPGWYFIIQRHLGLSAVKPASLSVLPFLVNLF